MTTKKLRKTKQPLGQHWLKDQTALQNVLAAGEIGVHDTVLEIGPGQGALTQLLVKKAKHVIAVELDSTLHDKLKRRFTDFTNLELVNQDILKFDLDRLPLGYKVVANIPYYLTGKLLRFLLESNNRPEIASLLVQREVAQRLVAQPGALSILGVVVQFYSDVSLGETVPANAFSPPPEVDSQIVQLKLRQRPLFDVEPNAFFKLVKAGFAERRKKLRSSLAGGLQISKPAAETILTKSGISPDARAQELSLEDWWKLYRIWSKA